MRPNPQFPTRLVTFTEEILNEKLHFLCLGYSEKSSDQCQRRIQNPVNYGAFYKNNKGLLAVDYFRKTLHL